MCITPGSFPQQHPQNYATSAQMNNLKQKQHVGTTFDISFR